MSLPIVIRPEAGQDLLEARVWYNRRSPGSGDEFVKAVPTVPGRLEEMPGLYAIVWRDVRRCRTRRFPYVIYYRVLADRVEVLAVLHGSRDPTVWRSRA